MIKTTFKFLLLSLFIGVLGDQRGQADDVPFLQCMENFNRYGNGSPEGYQAAREKCDKVNREANAKVNESALEAQSRSIFNETIKGYETNNNFSNSTQEAQATSAKNGMADEPENAASKKSTGRCEPNIEDNCNHSKGLYSVGGVCQNVNLSKFKQNSDSFCTDGGGHIQKDGQGLNYVDREGKHTRIDTHGVTADQKTESDKSNNEGSGGAGEVRITMNDLNEVVKKGLGIPVDGVGKSKPKADFEGGPTFSMCQTMLPINISWKELSPAPGNWLNASYLKVVKQSKYDDKLEPQQDLLIKEKKDEKSTPDQKAKSVEKNMAAIDKTLSSLISEISSQYYEIEQCVAVYYLTHARIDYDDSDHTGKSSSRSLDGKITCQTTGAEVQDYPACVKMITAYNALNLGEKVAHTVQEISFVDKQMDAQLDATKDPSNPTNVLRMQEKTVEAQSQIAKERAGISGAKVAALSAAVGAFPTRKDFVNFCKEKSQGQFQALKSKRNEILNYLNEGIGGLENEVENAVVLRKARAELELAMSDSKQKAKNPGQVLEGAAKTPSSSNSGGESQQMSHPCDIGYSSQLKLSINQKAQDATKVAAVEAGVELVSNVAKAAILDKQADRIRNAINGINVYKPGDDLGYGDLELLQSECQTSPELQKCIDAGFGRDQEFYGNGIIINGGVGQATGAGTQNQDADSFGKDGATLGQNGQALSAGTGASFIDGENKGSGILDSSYAATVKENKAANAGGGGGGGGGGASAPSSDPNAGLGQEGGVTEGRGLGSGASYTGTGNSAYFGGGNLVGKKEKVDNPFDSLIGKGAKSNDLKFRGPATGEIGNKGKSIFQTISERYQDMASKKRLVEYEVVK